MLDLTIRLKTKKTDTPKFDGNHRGMIPATWDVYDGKTKVAEIWGGGSGYSRMGASWRGTILATGETLVTMPAYGDGRFARFGDGKRNLLMVIQDTIDGISYDDRMREAFEKAGVTYPGN